MTALADSLLRTDAERAALRDGFYGGLLHVVWPVRRSRPLTFPRIFKA
jgi:hypothetical protein